MAVNGFELTSSAFEIMFYFGSPGSSFFQLFRLDNCSDVTLRNCRLGTTVNVYYLFGIEVIGGSGITIERNEVVNLFNTRPYNWGSGTVACSISNVTDCVFRWNEIHHINWQSYHNGGDAFITSTYGINFSGCPSGLEITNNLIYDIYDLSEADASNPYPDNYRSNTIDGITANDCPGAVIRNNTLDDFNPVALGGSQAGRVGGIYCGTVSQPAESYEVSNNIVSNMVATELVSQPIFYGAGFNSAFTLTMNYSNVYNLDLTNGGAEYYGMAIKGTGSFDNADNEDPQYGGPGPTFYHVNNPALKSDDGSEMGAFGGPDGDWTPPSQE
jgi:hypothetical protein